MSGDQVVVGAAVIRDGLLLAARRSAPPELAGGWELPGGKVDPGETEAQALARECREELGIEIAVGARVPGEWVLRPGLLLRVYLVALVAGEPAPLEDHDELRWIDPSAVADLAWLPADVAAVAAALALAGLPEFP